MAEPIAPVRRHVTVNVDPARAFRAFTQEEAAWWPAESHSMAADREDGTTVESLVFEEREGGRVYEIDSHGNEVAWATVTAWDPPNRFVLAWKPNLRDEPPTEVEVTFVPDGGCTSVDLEHRGWDRTGAGAAERAVGHETGGPSSSIGTPGPRRRWLKAAGLESGAMAVVRLRAPLKDLAGGNREVRLDGTSVGEVLRALENEHPRTLGWVLDEQGRIRRHVNVFVNGELIREDAPLTGDDVVHVLPSITGGGIGT